MNDLSLLCIRLYSGRVRFLNLTAYLLSRLFMNARK